MRVVTVRASGADYTFPVNVSTAKAAVFATWDQIRSGGGYWVVPPEAVNGKYRVVAAEHVAWVEAQ
jgi:hypothetical protein